MNLKQIPGVVSLADLSKTAIGAICFFTYRFIILRVTRPLFETLVVEKDPVKREKLVERACESTNKVSFHLLALVWGFTVIKRCGWLPSELGGTVPMSTIFSKVLIKEFPFGSPPAEVVTYGLYCAGYHVMDLIRHVFAPRKSDFVEMLFHHIVSVVLLCGYLMPNAHIVGAFFAVIHDVSDVCINVGRVFQGTKFVPVTATALILCWFSWIYTRLILLPYSIWLL